MNLSLQCDIHNKYVYGTHTLLSHCKIIWNILWFNGLLNSWWTNVIPIHHCMRCEMLRILILIYLNTKLKLLSNTTLFVKDTCVVFSVLNACYLYSLPMYGRKRSPHPPRISKSRPCTNLWTRLCELAFISSSCCYPFKRKLNHHE